LAADLGRPPEFVIFRWPDLGAQLRSNGFDVVMSGVTVRPDRALAFAFTRPYVNTGAVAVIRASERAKFRRVADLDQSNVRIAVNQGGHLEQVARRQFAHAVLMPVTDNHTLPDLLRRKAADAALSDTLEAHTWATGQFTFIGPFTRDRKAYAV